MKIKNGALILLALSPAVNGFLTQPRIIRPQGKPRSAAAIDQMVGGSAMSGFVAGLTAGGPLGGIAGGLAGAITGAALTKDATTTAVAETVIAAAASPAITPPTWPHCDQAKAIEFGGVIITKLKLVYSLIITSAQTFGRFAASELTAAFVTVKPHLSEVLWRLSSVPDLAAAMPPIQVLGSFLALVALSVALLRRKIVFEEAAALTRLVQKVVTTHMKAVLAYLDAARKKTALKKFYR